MTIGIATKINYLEIAVGIFLFLLGLALKIWPLVGGSCGFAISAFIMSKWHPEL